MLVDEWTSRRVDTPSVFTFRAKVTLKIESPN